MPWQRADVDPGQYRLWLRCSSRGCIAGFPLLGMLSIKLWKGSIVVNSGILVAESLL
ncbi:hypothetical protein N181_18535 [Sinorhizobium fredii USDA 205]|nr:hypothetical protein N181_18535 [Sinorhizobium fredii USDA 205]